MDICIQCDTCYDSCIERHGFQRLERGYAKFGILDVAKSCITCFYPTCIPPCPVDSVIFNPKSGEVEILDSCIGCQACARACQYGAIVMHKVVESDTRFARFLDPPKKKAPKLIADKCNHCYGHDDLACVAECPTGAIIELNATDFLENPTIFGVSENHRKPLPGILDSSWLTQLLQKVYFFIVVAITSFLSFEYLTITRWPHLSVLLNLQTQEVLPSTWTLNFTKGSDISLFIGNVGFTLIVLALLYPVRKAFPRLFRHLGRMPAWLDFHNFAALLGTVLVLFHTRFEFNYHFGSYAMATLAFLVFTGVFGRFLYQTIPRGAAGTELKVKDIEIEDRELSKKLYAIFEGSQRHQAMIDSLIEKTTKDVVQAPGLWSLIKSIVKSQWMIWSWRIALPADLQLYRKHMATFLALVKAKVRMRRNAALLAFTSRLFIKWRYIHKPAAYIMGIVAMIHVIYNLIFFSWGR